MTDFESQTPISYSSLIVTMAPPGLVFEIWERDRRQTNDSIA